MGTSVSIYMKDFWVSYFFFCEEGIFQMEVQMKSCLGQTGIFTSPDTVFNL